MSPRTVEIRGRVYALPSAPTALFCIDGCGPDYLDWALDSGLVPRLAQALREGGIYARARGQMPSFTNPNNLSIVTGQPPSVHGIAGNTLLDARQGREVAMTHPRFLRCPTIFERAEAAGVRTLCVTAKDKLRALLGASVEGGPSALSLSAEKAHEQTVPLDGRDVPVVELVGRPNPGIYDWDCSHYAMEIGLAVAPRIGARLVYVSLTDYVQHKEAPGGPTARRFFERFDELLGRFLDAGFLCALTADHGMNDKTDRSGAPNVRYLGDVLAAAGVQDAAVVLPITDPYVVHHGALGSFAMVHVPPSCLARARAAIEAAPGVEAVLVRDEAARRFRLPADRLGDLVVLGDRGTVLGKTASAHDLSAVRTGLRSHGGLHEATVPFVVCHSVTPEARARLLVGDVENADLLDFALNGIERRQHFA